MGWAIGYDPSWDRDVGYGVPAPCDQPDCMEEIDRGLAHVCGGDPYGGEHGCGLYFCGEHLLFGEPAPQCVRCANGQDPFTPKPDIREWICWKLADESWSRWRTENPAWVAANAEIGQP